MDKKKNRQPTSKELGEAIHNDFKRWKEIFNNGCSDSSWEDGVNTNLVRSQIIYDQKRVEEFLGDNYIAYPIEYFYPVPIILPSNFMAVDRKLNCRGGYLKSNKTLCYNEAVKFNWSEVMI